MHLRLHIKNRIIKNLAPPNDYLRHSPRSLVFPRQTISSVPHLGLPFHVFFPRYQTMSKELNAATLKCNSHDVQTHSHKHMALLTNFKFHGRKFRFPVAM